VIRRKMRHASGGLARLAAGAMKYERGARDNSVTERSTPIAGAASCTRELGAC